MSKTGKIVAYLFTAFICIVYSPNLFFFFVSLYLLYRMLSPTLHRDIFDSRLLKWVITLFTYMIILQCVTLSVWLLSKNFPLSECLPLTFALLVLAYMVGSKTRRQSTAVKKLPFVHRADVFAIVVTLAIVVPAVFQTFRGANVQEGFQLLASGSDDRVHQAMFDAKIRYDRGILYESDAGEHSGSDSYPTGWHAANAALAKAVYPSIGSASSVLIGYVFSKMFWIILLVFVFCRAVSTVYKTFTKGKPYLLASLWLGIGTFIFGRMVVFGFAYTESAYSFVPQLIAVLPLVLLLLQFSNDKSDAGRQNSLLLFSLIAIGGCLSWVLVLPAFCVAIMVLFIVQMKDRGWSLAWVHPMQATQYLLFVFLLVVAWAVQLYIMFTSKVPGSVSFVEGITMRGGIPTYDVEFYTLLLIGVAAHAAALYRKHRSHLVYIASLVLPLFVYSQIISIIQLVAVGENRYYFFKVVLLLTVMLLVYSIVGYAYLLDWLIKQKRNQIAQLLFVAIFFVSCHLFIRYLLSVL